MQNTTWVIIAGVVLVLLVVMYYEMDKKKKDHHHHHPHPHPHPSPHDACIPFGQGCDPTDSSTSLALCRQYLPAEQCMGYIGSDAQFDCTAAIAACNAAHPQ